MKQSFNNKNILKRCINCGKTEVDERLVGIGYGESTGVNYRINKYGYCQWCKRYRPHFAPVVYPNRVCNSAG